jgi:hypothetical protein
MAWYWDIFISMTAAKVPARTDHFALRQLEYVSSYFSSITSASVLICVDEGDEDDSMAAAILSEIRSHGGQYLSLRHVKMGQYEVFQAFEVEGYLKTPLAHGSADPAPEINMFEAQVSGICRCVPAQWPLTIPLSALF